MTGTQAGPWQAQGRGLTIRIQWESGAGRAEAPEDPGNGKLCRRLLGLQWKGWVGRLFGVPRLGPGPLNRRAQGCASSPLLLKASAPTPGSDSQRPLPRAFRGPRGPAAGLGALPSTGRG